MKIMSIAIFVAFLNTGCSLFQPSVKVCGNQFRQGENLPLNYSKIDESFLKSLQQVTKNNGDVVNLPSSGQDFMNSISTPAYFYWSAGFGSDGKKVSIRDANAILVLQDSIRWNQFESTSGICELIKK